MRASLSQSKTQMEKQSINIHSFLPCVWDYLQQVDFGPECGWQTGAAFDVQPLAQGEYNMNYLVSQGEQRWVLRLNLGSQIGRDDQIAYEYGALRLLAKSGVTPRACFLDDSRALLEQGLLLMEYLPGVALDYQTDLLPAARLFARLHTLEVSEAENHLLREHHPLTLMYEECSRLAQVYLQSELGDPFVRDILSEVLEWAGEARHSEDYYLADPIHCAINTEVNSGNFIANRRTGSLHLVDWEKPLWGDPSQDLSHFSVPTTTLWKTDYRMPINDRRLFLEEYRRTVNDRHLADTIEERVRLRDPFNCLRGITWSAMAWVSYQTGAHALRNADTFQKIETYLEPGFLRSLFDRYLK